MIRKVYRVIDRIIGIAVGIAVTIGFLCVVGAAIVWLEDHWNPASSEGSCTFYIQADQPNFWVCSREYRTENLPVPPLPPIIMFPINPNSQNPGTDL